jgi:DNA-binding beta-propeller fold protein YncE
MIRTRLAPALLALACVASALAAQQPSTDSPYKVLQRARVGGEGGTDYIFADDVRRRLYITRNAMRAVPATDAAPAHDAIPGRVTVFDLETLAPLGEVPNGGGNGAIVDPKSGHGFASSHPNVTMFDAKSMKLMKTIDVNEGNPPPAVPFSADGIYFNAANDRVYIGSHPTKELLVLDSHDGAVLGKIKLPGTPEQTIADNRGTLYALMQDSGTVAVVDEKAMKVTRVLSLGGNTGCNGLALDARNHVLFAACGRVGPPVPPQPGVAPTPPQPQMIILSSDDGKILTKLPLAGGSDGAAFNPATMEAFSSGGNGTLTVIKEKNANTFEVEENLQTMNGARTLSLDSKTGRIFVMSVERGAAPPPPVGGGRGGQAPVIPGSFTVVVIGK